MKIAGKVRLPFAAGLSCMVAVAAGGAVLVAAIAARVPNAPGTGAHAAYLAVIREAPIPIVQEATGWGVLIAVWAIFALLALLAWLTWGDRVMAKPVHVLLAFAIVAAVLTFFPISQSIDVYYYAAYARLYGVHGINPYDLAAALHLSDPTLEENLRPLGNPPFADSYGPGFTLIAGLVGRLEAGLSLWWQIWSWRVAAVLSALLVLAALLRTMRSSLPQERVQRLARVAFNPLILYEAAVGGHNDWLMVAPATWAFALIDDTPLIAGLLLGAAISIKYMAVVALPFAVVRAGRKNVVAGVVLAALAIVVPVLCSRPFALGETAATTLATVGSQLSMSLNWLLALPFFKSHSAQQPIVTGLGALPYLGVLTWPRALQLGLVASAGVVIVVSIARYARSLDRSNLYRSIAALLWALPAMHPWYMTWLSPALADRGRWSTYAAWYLALGLLVYAHEGLVLTPWREAVFVFLTIVVLAVPVTTAFLSRRQDEPAPTIKSG